MKYSDIVESVHGQLRFDYYNNFFSDIDNPLNQVF